jgi:ATP-dependent DNA helicase RecG
MLIHNPTCSEDIHQAQRRLKFEELFFLQLKLLMTKHIRMSKQKGFIMSDITLFNDFFNNHLTFELTNAQKKVLKEIYQDMSSGFQMNRLLQGDVGSGKTIVAFLAMLMALGNGYQVALMAPTEILAEQHYKNICDLCKDLGFHVALLTGSTRTVERKSILYYLSHGFVNILIGTHSLINDQVVYQKLGLVIIDEQHKFGVEQRAKVTNTAAHVLIMTATPIPRTLAMTLYGDLDVSVLNEMPPGRSPVKTIHIYESQRLRAIGLARQQIEKGHQVYFVFPLIEESKKLDLKNLMDGYENIKSYIPNTPISITHGNMLPKDKDIEMQKFVRGETKIMVSTTVIEVGINVPNATVIIIENANRFGLSQLHQLRGRVGRSDFQSFCVLITGVKLSKIGKQRLKAFVDISDGFELSNVDLQLRGEGDIMGNQQSGTVSMKIANLQTDYNILNCARIEALGIIKADPDLDNNPILKKNLEEKLDTNYSNVG